MEVGKKRGREEKWRKGGKEKIYIAGQTERKRC